MKLCFPDIAGSVLSVAAIILVAHKSAWGPILGLASEPFWIWVSLKYRLPGLFICTLLFAGSWAYAAWKWW